jgi:hypothetical protein
MKHLDSERLEKVRNGPCVEWGKSLRFDFMKHTP